MRLNYGTTYYVGDPVHVLSECDMLEVRTALRTHVEKTVYLQGETCWACRIDPNAEYADQNMNTFELPTGIIAVIHRDAIDDPEGEAHGAMFTADLDEDTISRDPNGDSVIVGNLVISKV